MDIPATTISVTESSVRRYTNAGLEEVATLVSDLRDRVRLLSQWKLQSFSLTPLDPRVHARPLRSGVAIPETVTAPSESTVRVGAHAGIDSVVRTKNAAAAGVRL